MSEQSDRGIPKRLNPEGVRLTPEQERAGTADRVRVLKALFAHGPVYGVAPPFAAMPGAGHSHGPNESFRRLRLTFVSGESSVDVMTALLDRLGIYLCELRRIPYPDEHLATEGVTARVPVSVDGAEVAFDTWVVEDGRTVAAAAVGERAILLDVRGAEIAGLDLERMSSLEPFLS